MASLAMRLHYPIVFRASADPLDYPVDLSRTPEFPPIGCAVRGEDGLLRMDYARVGNPALGLRLNPALVAWDALAHPGDAGGFARHAAWLADHAVAAPDGKGVCWTVEYAWEEAGTVLVPPWPYGLAQGLAASVMARAWRRGLGERYRDLALAAEPRFETPLEEGGILARSGGDVFLEMYPVRPAQRILDGHGFLLCGLRDIAALGDERAARLAEAALASLGRRIGDWDWRGTWSTYGTGGQLASGFYHALNHAWVSAFAAWAPGSDALARAARAWDPERLSAVDRARVYLAFKGKALRAAVAGS